MHKLILFILLCALPAAAQTTHATVESERALANFAQMVKQKHMFIAVNDPRAEMVQRIGLRLANQARRPVPWQFVIVGDSSPNAACTGEGIVYVTTGLLDLKLDEDELAGILAHEVAHGARHHIERDRLQWQRARDAYHSVDIQTATTRLQNDLREAREAPTLPGATQSPGSQASMVDRLQISEHILQSRREDAAQVQRNFKVYQQHHVDNSWADEREADQIGMRYAYGAGYSQDGLARALEKLRDRRVRLGQNSALGPSDSHPPLDERIQLLRSIMDGRMVRPTLVPSIKATPIPVQTAGIWK
jgi:predicted Zn-dependent protease